MKDLSKESVMLYSTEKDIFNENIARIFNGGFSYFSSKNFSI